MEIKGGFIGFTFGNRHSSQLGIFRTNESDRYSITLTPQYNEKILNLNGVDGTYYWGSDYSTKEIPISFAFYGFTEMQLRELKQLLNDHKIHNLILDEEPYKVWSAKLTNIATIKHICFEDKQERFYCGEGTLTFTAYYPYARSRYLYIENYNELNIKEWNSENKYLHHDISNEVILPAIITYDFGEDESAKIVGLEHNFKAWLDDISLLVTSDLDLNDINSEVDIFGEKTVFNNLEEWRESSRIPSMEDYGQYIDSYYHLYNAGDISAPFKLYLPITSTPTDFVIQCNSEFLQLKNVMAKKNDYFILIDTANQIIVGCNEKKQATNNLYNETIQAGQFFNLPVGEIDLISPQGQLDFNYLYL